MVRTLLVAALVLSASSGMASAQPVDAVAAGAASSHISALIDRSAALALPARIERAFMLTLHAAGDALGQGDAAKALTLLKTFAFEVRGVKRARRIRADVADDLVARAGEAMSALGGLETGISARLPARGPR